jgi:hypothetical protein
MFDKDDYADADGFYARARLTDLAARQAERDKEREERARNHAAWLRLCGSVAPIGKLQD